MDAAHGVPGTPNISHFKSLMCIRSISIEHYLLVDPYSRSIINRALINRYLYTSIKLPIINSIYPSIHCFGSPIKNFSVVFQFLKIISKIIFKN